MLRESAATEREREISCAGRWMAETRTGRGKVDDLHNPFWGLVTIYLNKNRWKKVSLYKLNYVPGELKNQRMDVSRM